MDKNAKIVKFGGKWTNKKLRILEEYLDAYTTALKRQPFRLIYIDAFAGTGRISPKLRDNVSHIESREFILGSASIALKVRDKHFDHLQFVELDAEKQMELNQLKDQHSEHSIEVIRNDANRHIKDLNKDSFRQDGQDWRGVLFLDPFSTEVDWSTTTHIARLERLDTWMLFPIGALSRLMPRDRDPSEVHPSLVDILNRVFGDDRWRQLYSKPAQGDFFKSNRKERTGGVEALLRFYMKQLHTVFGSRLLKKSIRLSNSKNAPLYEFIFCAGSPRGKNLAHKIAAYLMGLNSH